MSRNEHKVKRCYHKIGKIWKDITRKKKLEEQIQVDQYDSVHRDYLVAEAIFFYLFGSMCDFILDSIYERQSPLSLVNAILPLLLSIIFYGLPSIFIFSEIVGSTSGLGSLYNYCYVGNSEILASLTGYLIFIVAIARVSVCYHFIISKITKYFEGLIGETLMRTGLTVLVSLFLPFTSKKIGLCFIGIGMLIRLIIILFLFGYTEPPTLANLPLSVNIFGTFVMMLKYCEMFIVLPIVTVTLSSCFRLNLLIRKMIYIFILILIFYLFYFIIVFNNESVYEPKDYWVTTLLSKYRPLPYLCTIIVTSFVTMFCGIFSLMYTSSIIIDQMSTDGLVIKFLHSSEGSRNIWFVFHYMNYFFWGEEFSYQTFVINGSLVMLIAAFSLLYLRVNGCKDFYIPLFVMCDDGKEKPIFTSLRKVSKLFLFLFFVGLIFLSTSLVNVFYDSFLSQVVFILVLIVGLTLIVISVGILIFGARYRSICSPYHCPVAPLLCFCVIITSLLNIIVNVKQIHDLLLHISLILIWYFWYGLSSASLHINEENTRRVKNKAEDCKEKLEPKKKLFNILDKYSEEAAAARESFNQFPCCQARSSRQPDVTSSSIKDIHFKPHHKHSKKKTP